MTLATLLAMAQRAQQIEVDPEELPEVLQFMRLLWELVHSLDRTSKHMTREFGITGPQRLALRVIGLFPGISAGQLAHILHVHPSTLTGILQRLIDQRLIQRTAARHDKRRAQLRLTVGGAQLNKPTKATVESAIAATLSATSRRDRAAAQRLIAALSTQLAARLSTAD